MNEWIRWWETGDEKPMKLNIEFQFGEHERFSLYTSEYNKNALRNFIMPSGELAGSLAPALTAQAIE